MAEKVLPQSSRVLEDPCLATPLPITALLDAAAVDDAVQAVDDAVQEALIAKGNPAFRNREAAAEARGETRGKATGRTEGITEAILAILDARGLGISQEQREAIASCRDRALLDRWLRRAALASSADDITSAS